MSDARAPSGRVLIIAGSDSGGGAGIQADIKTVTMLGGYAMTAITAITAQDTTGVHGVWPIAPDAVTAQIRSCLTDIGADAVKTGMLGTATLVDQVAETLDTFARETPKLIDPVMVATSGDQLVDEKAVSAIASVLIPGAKLVTPNAPEAEVLTGKAVDGLNGQRRAAEALLETGARGALVKGGHIPGAILHDVLQTEYGEWIFESPRIETSSTHGTGCTLASACAALVAQGQDLADAVEAARNYLHHAIEQAEPLGKGHGPVAHNWQIKQMDQQD
ncbi:MAG: bifunctional hydroxymethylpyrimidine kinase/phosphomethylpyrimidine kinase [Pseudomonadota bacterium]